MVFKGLLNPLFFSFRHSFALFHFGEHYQTPPIFLESGLLHAKPRKANNACLSQVKSSEFGFPTRSQFLGFLGPAAH